MPAQRVEAEAGGSEFNNLFVDGPIYFAGQPTEQGLSDLAELGVTTVINLRPPAEMAERVKFDEPALVEKLGMKYVSLPMTGKSYSVETVDALAEILDETQGKILLHCGSSNRVGVLWANYLARHRDIELEEAIERLLEALEQDRRLLTIVWRGEIAETVGTELRRIIS